MEVNEGRLIDRIIETLQADETFNKEIAEFRFGELPENANANSYPAVFVATAPNSEKTQNFRYPAKSDNSMAGRDVATEIWVIIVNEKNEGVEEVQRSLFDLKEQVVNILKANIHLRSINASDGLAGAMELFTIGRNTQQRGKLMDAITVRVIVHNTIL